MKSLGGFDLINKEDKQMGTLYEQRIRWDYSVNTLGKIDYCPGNMHYAEGTTYTVEQEVIDMLGLASKYEVSLTDLIAIKHYMILDRANNLRAVDYDIKDEQLAGLGQEIKGISDAILELATVI